MFANIKVITGAARDSVLRKSNGELLVKVTVAAERGKANKRVQRLLADYYDVPISSITFVKGAFTSRKVVAIAPRRASEHRDKQQRGGQDERRDN